MTEPAELQAAADAIGDAMRARLDDDGWVGAVVTYPSPIHSNAITVEVTPEAFPAPGVEAGQVLVPYEAWTDAAAQSSIVDYLISRWLPEAS